jgi:hypothetical protein
MLVHRASTLTLSLFKLTLGLVEVLGVPCKCGRYLQRGQEYLGDEGARGRKHKKDTATAPKTQATGASTNIKRTITPYHNY